MSGGKVKKGGKWTAKVIFYSESSGSGQVRQIADKDLIHTLDQWIGASDLKEQILYIRTCRTPLSEKQLTSLLFYHEFVVFSTSSFYYSIEKNGEGIHIQRSRNGDNVLNRFNREKRLKGSSWQVETHREPHHPLCVCTVRDVMVWLWGEDELNQEYSYLQRNCKHLAKNLYYHITRYYR